MPATASYRPEDIRNIVLVGHGGAGKTTLAEAMLHRCGVITRMGSVEEANTASDFEPEAKEHKHSTSSTLLFATHEGKEINLIDTPGYPDFIGQALAALPAVETAVIVVNAETRHRGQHPPPLPRRRRNGPGTHDRHQQNRQGPRPRSKNSSPRSRKPSARNSTASTCPRSTAATWSTASTPITARLTSATSKPSTRRWWSRSSRSTTRKWKNTCPARKIPLAELAPVLHQGHERRPRRADPLHRRQGRSRRR